MSHHSEAIAFIKLKAACNLVMQEPNVDNIKRLEEVVNGLSPLLVQKMLNHLLFVLVQHLQHHQLRCNVKIALAECLQSVIVCCKISEMEFGLLEKLLLCFMGIMYNPENDSLIKESPEELHVICLKCTTLLLCKTNPQQRAQLYSPKRAPILGVFVCLCLKQATTQMFKTLKLCAIECLMACGQVLEQSQLAEAELQVQTANIFMNFTPGIAAGLQQVICADEKQGHAVTVVAIRAWGRLLAQVLDESTLPSSDNMGDEAKQPCTPSLASASTAAEMEQVMSVNQRSVTWLSHADSKLVGNVCAVCAAQQHSHFKVRLELVQTCKLLLSKCSRSVPQCVAPLVDVLVTLSEDDEVEVSSEARRALELIANKCDDQSLVEIMEGRFFTIISSLPATFIHADTRYQRTQLGLLLGYLRVLSTRLPAVLLLSCNCDALLQSLLQVATLECSAVTLLEDCALRDLSDGQVSRQWCRLRYCNDASVVEKLSQVCQVLGKHADVSVLCTQLLHVFTVKLTQRREATLLLNQLLTSACPGNEEEHFSMVCSVLMTYLDPAVWNMPLSMQDESWSEVPTLAAVKGNVVQACLMVEGIAQLAATIGPLIRRVLAEILYPVLERAGSPLELVSQAGRCALGVLARTLGYATPARLIEQEADYFSHTVEVRLRRPRDNPGALLVLSAVLTHSNRDVLPCIQQLISDVLVRSCDSYQEHSLTAYLHVFHTFLLSIQRWLNEECDSTKSSKKKVSGTNNKETTTSGDAKSLLVQELLVHHKWRLTTGAEEDDEEEDAKPVIQEATPAEETEKVVPDYVKMTEAVMSRCIHALPSRDRGRQLLALSSLTIGIQILTLHEDQLLPMVHKIWSPLCQRFSPNQDIVVLRQSFELLCTMAHAAKDFLRQRTLDKVLPSITNFLLKQAVETKKQRCCPLFSQSVQLQRVALERLGQLACDLQLQEEALDAILVAAAPYLSDEQPQMLQDCGVDLYSRLASICPDAVWLQLRCLWNCKPELLPLHPSCRPIRLPRSTLDAQHFKKNVELLENEV